jgi:hypothetical protein
VEPARLVGSGQPQGHETELRGFRSRDDDVPRSRQARHLGEATAAASRAFRALVPAAAPVSSVSVHWLARATCQRPSTLVSTPNAGQVPSFAGLAGMCRMGGDGLVGTWTVVYALVSGR